MHTTSSKLYTLKSEEGWWSCRQHSDVDFAMRRWMNRLVNTFAVISSLKSERFNCKKQSCDWIYGDLGNRLLPVCVLSTPSLPFIRHCCYNRNCILDYIKMFGFRWTFYLCEHRLFVHDRCHLNSKQACSKLSHERVRYAVLSYKCFVLLRCYKSKVFINSIKLN